MTVLEQLHPQYIKDPKNGTDSFVILPAEEFEELLQDIQDLAVIAERKDEEKISFDEMTQELGIEL